MPGFDPFSIIGDAVGKIIDLFPKPEDKLKAQELQNQITLALNDAQSKLNQAQASIIVAEANSDSVLAKNWRPITMLTFVALVVCHWFGLNASGISEAQYLSLFDLIKIGLGGYVVGRSLEKVADSVGDSFGKK
jgi:hypothetical protein